jgi:peptide/nickel transport system ATP-binding protein
LLLSAVPDPDMRFDDPKARLLPHEVEDIRARSAVPQEDTVEVEPGHFIRYV